MLQNQSLPHYTEEGEYIFTVEELNQAAALNLKNQFKSILIRGEVSNFSRPSSGHIYFSLKDEKAQIRCAWFRGKQTPLSFELQSGLSILALAEVTIYTERGDYQLIIQKVFLSGQGVIQAELEALKRKLSAAGLFLAEHKKPLPTFPKRIGIITSKTGAALQDILAIFKRRAPFIEIFIFPCQVQGAEAAPSMIRAIQKANREASCEALILTRGGGSNEDLWAFNHPDLAYAIFNSSQPIISAVGHEIDLTISDLTADHRASTPSAAAELLSPNQEELTIKLNALQRRLHQNIIHSIQNQAYRLDQNLRLIRRPREKLQEKIHFLLKAKSDLNKIIHKAALAKKSQFNLVKYALQKSNPKDKLTLLKNELDGILAKLKMCTLNKLYADKYHFTVLLEKIETLSPINTLRRGYSILYTDKKDLLCDVKQTQVGEKISAQLSNGRLSCRVEKIDTST